MNILGCNFWMLIEQRSRLVEVHGVSVIVVDQTDEFQKPVGELLWIKLITGLAAFNAMFQFCPARVAIRSGDDELSLLQRDFGWVAKIRPDSFKRF